MTKRIAGWLLRFGILSLCVGYALWDVDFPLLGAALMQYSFAKIMLVLALTCVAYLALAARLVTLLRGISGEPTIRTTLAASLFALGMNNLLPARLGEVAKVVYLRQKCDASTGRLMGAVFWERFADIHALLFLCVATLVAHGRADALVPIAASVAIGWVSLIWLRYQPRALRLIIRRLPNRRLRQLGHDVVGYLGKSLGFRIGVELTAWTAVTWFFYALHLYLVVIWIAEIDLTLGQVITALLGISLGMAVPVSPGALGIYESIVVLILGWYGVAPEVALAAALTAHMLQYIPTTMVGAVVLSQSNVSVRSLAAARQVPSNG